MLLFNQLALNSTNSDLLAVFWYQFCLYVTKESLQASKRLLVQRCGGTARLFPSLPLFQDSLHSLMTTLGQANPYFIRCIKPNGEKVPDNFVPEMVLNQLKYSGVCGLLSHSHIQSFPSFTAFRMRNENLGV